jgi:hypothetical protein
VLFVEPPTDPLAGWQPISCSRTVLLSSQPFELRDLSGRDPFGDENVAVGVAAGVVRTYERAGQPTVSIGAIGERLVGTETLNVLAGSGHDSVLRIQQRQPCHGDDFTWSISNHSYRWQDHL